MRVLALFILVLFLCPLTQWFGLVAPVAEPTAPAVSVPHVEISADSVNVQVGDSVMLSGVPGNIGLPYYTLTLSSGASVRITYSGEVRGETDASYLARDAVFEIVSAQADMNHVTFLLRALAPGSVEAVISATGEVRSPEGAFMWSGGTSEALSITVSE